MPLNIPGLLVPFQLLCNPRIVVPRLIVRDIRQLDFAALRREGYRGVVFDKDNCITVPHHDTLVPELSDAWHLCRETFGKDNVLIVSNSAGTYLDAGGIQAESVSYNTDVPVLFHTTMKPGYSCIKAIQRYYGTLPSPVETNELIIIGDRLFTDVVMGNRMRSSQSSTRVPMTIWTTALWKQESLLMRWFEKILLKAVLRWSSSPGSLPVESERYVKKDPPSVTHSSFLTVFKRLFGRFRSV